MPCTPLFKRHHFGQAALIKVIGGYRRIVENIGLCVRCGYNRMCNKCHTEIINGACKCPITEFDLEVKAW